MSSKDVAEHELRISTQFFDVVESGEKPFEIRKGDRPFKIGDILWLREVNIVLAYTGREMRKRITYCLRGWGMEDGCVALGLAPLHDETEGKPHPAWHTIVSIADDSRYSDAHLGNVFRSWLPFLRTSPPKSTAAPTISKPPQLVESAPDDHYCAHGFSLQSNCHFCGRYP